MANPPAGIRVVLAGATGLVGGHCLTQLLADEGVAHITVIARHPLTQTDPKLTVQVVDFEHLRGQVRLPEAEAVLCSLGTTHRAAGTPEAFAKVDQVSTSPNWPGWRRRGAFPALFWCRRLADPTSPVFYHRVKGRAEAAVSELHFKAVHLLRPSLLIGIILNPSASRGLGQETGAALGAVRLGAA